MPSSVGGEAVVTNDWYIKRKSEKMMLLMYNPCKFYSMHHQANFIYAPLLFFFCLSFMARQDYFPHFEFSQVGQKQVIPEKKNPEHPQA